MKEISIPITIINNPETVITELDFKCHGRETRERILDHLRGGPDFDTFKMVHEFKSSMENYDITGRPALTKHSYVMLILPLLIWLIAYSSDFHQVPIIFGVVSLITVVRLLFHNQLLLIEYKKAAEDFERKGYKVSDLDPRIVNEFKGELL